MYMENSQLIDLLEAEMKEDIKAIDLTSDEEATITFEKVLDWYFEAEKVIRVLGNILTVPMTQAINQLRYAGHHILKASTNKKCEKANNIEAFKHCKRAVYDSLDFYVYTLNERYRTLMPYLDSQNAIKAETLLHSHIKKIHEARSDNDHRIDYYKIIQKTLIEGLKLVEEINEIQREASLGKELYSNKKKIVNENIKLQEHVNTLQTKNEELAGKLSGRFNFFTLILGLCLSIAAIIGLIVADTYIVNKHEVIFMPTNNTPASLTQSHKK